jgi:hypothetical protein
MSCKASSLDHGFGEVRFGEKSETRAILLLVVPKCQEYRIQRRTRASDGVEWRSDRQPPQPIVRMEMVTKAEGAMVRTDGLDDQLVLGRTGGESCKDCSRQAGRAGGGV